MVGWISIDSVALSRINRFESQLAPLQRSKNRKSHDSADLMLMDNTISQVDIASKWGTLKSDTLSKRIATSK